MLAHREHILSIWSFILAHGPRKVKGLLVGLVEEAEGDLGAELDIEGQEGRGGTGGRGRAKAATEVRRVAMRADFIIMVR